MFLMNLFDRIIWNYKFAMFLEVLEEIFAAIGVISVIVWIIMIVVHNKKKKKKDKWS